MQRRTRIAFVAGVTTIVLGGAGAAVVNATTPDADTPITGTNLDRASAAALAETGQGRVTGTEVGDEDSFYEVEVTLDDGSQVDVQLDKNFAVVKTMADGETDKTDTGQD
jgi:uncharacterized membrane protein YkoI